MSTMSLSQKTTTDLQQQAFLACPTRRQTPRMYLVMIEALSHDRVTGERDSGVPYQPIIRSEEEFGLERTHVLHVKTPG